MAPSAKSLAAGLRMPFSLQWTPAMRKPVSEPCPVTHPSATMQRRKQRYELAPAAHL